MKGPTAMVVQLGNDDTGIDRHRFIVIQRISSTLTTPEADRKTKDSRNRKGRRLVTLASSRVVTSGVGISGLPCHSGWKRLACSPLYRRQCDKSIEGVVQGWLRAGGLSLSRAFK
jgi:hypothetical protein